MTDAELQEVEIKSLALPDDQLLPTLNATVYPGAKPESVQLVLDYCRAQHLDPLMRPVHIVPMYVEDKVTGRKGYRDCILPGIDLYRVRASRTGEHVGTSEPEFGDFVELKLGGETVRVPEWCKVTVRRVVNGVEAEYPHKEYWVEAYASKGRNDPTPNYMWMKRPVGQICKCAEAGALRKAFPESSPLVTAEEMAGKPWGEDSGTTIEGEFGVADDPPKAPKAKPEAEAKPEPKPKPEAKPKAASKSQAKREAVQKGTTIEGEAQTATDDAEQAKPAAEGKAVRYISDGQKRLIDKQLGELNIDPADLCHAMEIDAIEAMPALQINAALKWLKLQKDG